jgi:hypothetical protein
MPNSLKELVWRNSTKMGPVPRAITNYIDLARKDALSRNLAPLMGKATRVPQKGLDWAFLSLEWSKEDCTKSSP